MESTCDHTGEAAKEHLGGFLAITPDITKKSRWLGQLLRHRLHQTPCKYRSDGYARIVDIFQLYSTEHRQTVRFSPLTMRILGAIVSSDPKERYSVWMENGIITWIRANQGHSIPDLKDAYLFAREAGIECP